MNNKNGMKYFKKIMQIMNKKTPIYFIFTIADSAIISICYNIVLAFILKEVIDAIAYHNIKLIRKAFYIAIVSFLIAFVFEPIIMKIKNYCVRSTIGAIKKDSFGHIENIKVDTYEKYSSGDILSRMTKDIDTLEDVYLKYIPNLCFAIIHGGVAMVSMIYINYFLGILAIMLGLFSVLVNYFISRKVNAYSGEYQKEYGNLYQNIIDIYDGFIDIKMNGSEGYFYNKFKSVTKKLQHDYEKREKYNALLETNNTFFENINNIGLMAVGLFMALKGYTTIGAVISVIKLQGNASYLF
ncbi:ABC transporter ATP-binding protein [Clostridium sp. JN-9]|uniref:ABC transporter transmembrane domain-containing protein n=1 Tax=Clostridium sp. JN-9 TaxID=2507159 RepID=UPI000FFE0BF4|nr:ABC transporter ATP-binding protein [Clostridium sp. JN-9]QAT38933.1 ABC transporter ATP-binding protein [Clostridium sp. JN-9]